MSFETEEGSGSGNQGPGQAGDPAGGAAAVRALFERDGDATARGAAEGAAKDAGGPPGWATRRRATAELLRRHERALRRTARRYSLCDDDAEDAFQRALEIVLTKAPTDDVRELIRWTQTVTKHEALALRRKRERMLGAPPPREGEGAEEHDWVSSIPSDADGPAERVERREAVARSREALRALKPQELRALTLLAEGYSYAEISAITGFSRTKVNRCLAEGRERFRRFLASSAEGKRCAELRPLLSAFCDGEAGDDTDQVREHLRACPHCRAALRAYRAAPQAAAALAPLLPVSRPLLERAHEALAGLAARLSGHGANDSISGMLATGGARGAGSAALAKALALCLGTAGGAAACVAAGVVPAPLGIGPGADHRPAHDRPAGPPKLSAPALAPEAVTEPPPAAEPLPRPKPKAEDKPKPPPEPTPEPASATSGAVEYSPAPAPEATPPPPPSPPSGVSEGSSGSPAGEFGP